ncbi:MAG: hypothetical protein ACRELF_02540 [Gemmataceae bacterium]
MSVMPNVQVIWDLEDDPQGNVRHVAENDVPAEEVEEVLENHFNEAVVSASSGNPITFGWTSTGKYLAVVFEKVQAHPPTAYPITAYPANPPRKKRRKK